MFSSIKSSSSNTVRRLVGNRYFYTTVRCAAGRGRMGGRNQQVWDSSRGVVFAGQSRGFTPSLMRPTEAGERTTVERETFEKSVEEGGEVAEERVEVKVEKVETVGVTGEEGQEKAEDGEKKVEGGEKEEKREEEVLTPPHTPLDYKIPDDIFLAAKKAPEGSPKSYWSYQMYRGPQNLRPKVHYCTTQTVAERVIQRYFLNEPLLGFDLEWMADALPWHGARKNVSLIQIASPTRIALFHVALYPKSKPLATPLLKKILEDPKITKVGVWVMGDASKVQRYLKITPRGLFELSHLYKLVKYCESGEHSLINKKLVSLGKQAEEVLKLPLYKELDVRTSNWLQSLRLDQIIYSASDAYAGVQIYSMLNHQRLQLSPSPPLPHPAELKLPIELPDHTVLPPSTETDEIEMTPAEAVSDPKLTTTTTTTKKPRESSTFKKEKHPLVREADMWLAQYFVSHPQPANATSATAVMPSHLRAYYIWHHNPEQSIQDICALLRDPPLQVATVENYIFKAIKRAGVQYDKARVIEMLEAKRQAAAPGAKFFESEFLSKLKKEEEAAMEETVMEETRREDSVVV
ncbi:uncharacterized protein PODANS_2_5830 [Podospora anserina S mat+]|uniref:Podospora anserina S mat+ genomic DNA chromosome 2, supercontig 2 n=1 Tax=Podospora anserina (strain S / ATCC MYA-4624 / DSM 980 / FGSC 10383) TaxID=515849 RepID=B2B5U9_PODAN|nr:uncharacterized protein PODANS_2_5830 [Podospora anserina S mat+]CAP73174.1 unnamed protein product [Podospora anserina S mat+]CDP25577.1 Putative Werner syndrome ATP-dependent helicase [Podospora anserina S mat+]